jgi:deazaflavin-dependent oxidoreductase (nitroreductase family)
MTDDRGPKTGWLLCVAGLPSPVLGLFSREDLMDDTSQLPYLYLTTTGWKSGKPHEIEIWFIELGGRYYLISELGEKAHWVQNLRRQLAVAFRVGKHAFKGTARVVEASSEPELHRQVCALSEEKYDWGDGLVVELTPE